MKVYEVLYNLVEFGRVTSYCLRSRSLQSVKIRSSLVTLTLRQGQSNWSEYERPCGKHARAKWHVDLTRTCADTIFLSQRDICDMQKTGTRRLVPAVVFSPYLWAENEVLPLGICI